MDNLKEATLQSELRFKDLVINPCHRSVLINNNRIDLTTKEFDLLVRTTGLEPAQPFDY